MEEISQREFSRRLDVSEATIRKVVAAGYISAGVRYKENGRPVIIYETALTEWNQSPAGIQAAEKKIGRPSNATHSVKTPDKKAAISVGNQNPQLSPMKEQLFDPEAANAKRELLDEKRTQQRVKTQRDAIELQRLVGQLVDKEKVYTQLYEFGKGLRENILIIPDRYIDQIISAPDRHTAHQILYDGLLEALRGLSAPPDISNVH